MEITNIVLAAFNVLLLIAILVVLVMIYCMLRNIHNQNYN